LFFKWFDSSPKNWHVAISGLSTYTPEKGAVPRDGIDAVISPISKKRNVHLASNNRPVSLTCTLSKVIEHIVKPF
jgi:hypothetical protein